MDQLLLQTILKVQLDTRGANLLTLVLSCLGHTLAIDLTNRSINDTRVFILSILDTSVRVAKFMT